MSVATKIQLAGVQAHECGYCKSEGDTSISYGFVSPVMLTTDYEYLMLRGWRRSGTYFYKPTLHKTCCPSYTIRLNVSRFQPSKSQKKVLRRTKQHLQKSEHSMQKVDCNAKEGGEEMNEEILIETEKASYSEEKFALYKQYQCAVHNDKPDEVTPKGFTRFLIDSPLVDTRTDFSASSGFGYGTYHQLYRLAKSGKLIAVGVIDLVPSGVSSVYCFYDVDYRALVLGKYTALKEIEFCRTHHFSFYYMGFYIHSCVKMRYKGEYKPSELLCSKTYQWIPLDECIPLLEEFKFTPFASPYREIRRELFRRKLAQKSNTSESSETAKEDFKEDELSLERFIAKEEVPLDVNLVPLDLGEKYPLMTVNLLSKSFQDYFIPLLQEWIQVAGNDVARRFQVMLY